MDKSLKYYNAFRKFRKHQNERLEDIKIILQETMESYVVNYNPRILEQYSECEWNEEGCDEFFCALDYITEFYVRCSLTKVAIIEDFEIETDLSRELCEFYANLYWVNRQELKLNAIMRELDK